MTYCKARITRKDYENFKSYYNGEKIIIAARKELPGNMREAFDNIFNLAVCSLGNKYTFNDNHGQLEVLVDYCDENNLPWVVRAMNEHFLLLSFSGTEIFWDKEYCSIIEFPEYNDVSMSELSGHINTNMASASLPAEMGSLTINKVNAQKSDIEEKQKNLKKQLEDISFCRTKELSEMEEKIRQMQNELYERKSALKAELDKKMTALQEEMDKLNKQIYVMESQIYTIRSYNGETLELKLVRSGAPAPADTPLTVNQKMMYLDEDLARIVSIYKHEIAAEFGLFEDAIKYNDDVFESFCPQERCITFFRLSYIATYNRFNTEYRMYQAEELIHGKKIGFVLRDGERAYMGWLDEEWGYDNDAKGKKVPRNVTFTEDLMYQPDKTVSVSDVDDAKYGLTSDSKNSMLSRLFAMSVVQGVLDNGNILSFPEKVNIMSPGKYIFYNYAKGWIMDDRFGDFATLVENLNKRTKVKDPILVTYSRWHCDGHGENDRTHDCELVEGINKVNLIEADKYGNYTIYISVKKKYSHCGATANVKLKHNEYINLAYMNSVWLTYYVQTKKMGAYAEDYAKMVKHFKRAIEILIERENEEMALIKVYYPDADKIPDWQVKLSHWKLCNKIRFINDFQAKRIAKYLESGQYYEMKNLFDAETFYNDVNETNCGEYSHTQFSWNSLFTKPKSNGFNKESEYFYQTFYVRLNNREWDKESQEEDAATLAQELPKLEALVPRRLEKDEEKLDLVKRYVMVFLKEHDVLPQDVISYDGMPLNGLMQKSDGTIEYIRANDLTKDVRERFFTEAEDSYPRYLLASDCWKVAYYDYIQWQYGKILENAKMVLHKRFMEDIVYTQE